jgi:hypothetical protein
MTPILCCVTKWLLSYGLCEGLSHYLVPPTEFTGKAIGQKVRLLGSVPPTEFIEFTDKAISIKVRLLGLVPPTTKQGLQGGKTNHPAEEGLICIAMVPNASATSFVHPRHLCALCSYFATQLWLAATPLSLPGAGTVGTCGMVPSRELGPLGAEWYGPFPELGPLGAGTVEKCGMLCA